MSFKKIFFPLLSAFLAFRSFELVTTVWHLSPSETSITAQLFIALALNLFITGVFAFVGFAYPTSKLLPNNYYAIQYPKQLRRFSNLTGIEYFKKFLLALFWGTKKNRKKYFDGTISGLDNFEFQTRQSEFGHLLPFTIIQVVVGLAIVKGHYTIALITMLVNVVFNFYPIVLQRNHRVRITKLCLLLKKRQSL